MNCPDFEQAWNQLLDLESGPPRDAGPSVVALEAGLREHAGSCPECDLKHGRFEALRVAMRAWAAAPRPEPSDPGTIADRVVRLAAEPAALPMPDRRRAAREAGLAGLLTAAAAAALFLVMRPAAERAGPAPAPRRVTLGGAVAEAREASWKLARTASEPAARLGMAMLVASLSPDDEAADRTGSTPADDGGPGILGQFGGYAAAGARPLSDAARRAFGFLRSPSFDKAAPPAIPKGA